MKKIWKYTTIILILLLAFSLRFYKYAQFPVAGETMDEYAWTFLGSSLIQERMPTSWSYFDAYSTYTVFKFQNAEFRMVKPVMDHPPLFSFIPGIFHLLQSLDWQLTPSMTAIRFPMVILGVINVGLFYLLSKKFFSDKWAVISSLIYATAPSFVFASRLVVAENLLVTWMLLLLIILSAKVERKQLIWIFLISLLATLTKASGIIIPIIAIFYSLFTKKYQITKWALLGLIGGGLIFAVYGWIYDFSIFTKVIFSQSSRDVGLSTLVNRFFLHPVTVEKIMLNGWNSLGLLSLILLFFQKEQKWQKISLSLVCILGFSALFVGESTFHGWYDYLLYPLMALSLTILWQYLIDQRQVILFGFVWLFYLPIFREVITHLGLKQDLMVRPLVGFAILPTVVSWVAKKRLIGNLLTSCLLLLLFLNIIVVLVYKTEIYWLNDAFYNPIRTGF